ncbi:MAG: GAF and ANTAR domain-containing protein [Patescibacteria group bacterium]|nr:GAF and ANTAR domain-containing protein [Patescibacteria group bacterium]
MMIKTKYSELKRELDFLYRIAQSVHSLEIEELFREILKIALEVTAGDSCLIYTYDSQKQILTLRASKNPHPALLQRVSLKLGEGITGWVAKEKETVMLEDGAYKDIRFKTINSLPEDRFEGFLSVPILNRHGVAGVINIQYRKKHKYTKMEINLLAAIGKLVGGALENALLIEETLSLREALELRKLIEKAKGILMKRRNLSEEAAYKLIQKESMNSRKSLKEIAEAVILADRMKFES